MNVEHRDHQAADGTNPDRNGMRKLYVEPSLIVLDAVNTRLGTPAIANDGVTFSS